jgi:hypothetical protein
VAVETEGTFTTLVSPAAFAVDSGTSTLVDGLDAAEVSAAAGTTKMGTARATTDAEATTFRARFFTKTVFLGEEASRAPPG